ERCSAPVAFPSAPSGLCAAILISRHWAITRYWTLGEQARTLTDGDRGNGGGVERIVTGLKLKHTRMTGTIIAEHTHELARPSLNTPAIPFDRTCNLRSQRRRRRDRRHLAKVLLRASL